jgi:multidrug efflux pump subunit AcrB
MMGYTTGEYIRSMPLTVIYTLAASLFVALTLTPFLCSRFLKFSADHKESPIRRFIDLLIIKTYRPTLAQALNHPRMTIILVLAAFGLSLFLFQFVGISFFPKAEKPQLIININTP